MHSLRFLIPASAVLSLSIVVFPAKAQRGAAPPTADGYTMPLLVTGSVLLSDGTKAPPNALVRIVCATGTFRGAAYTDTSGNFNIVVGTGAASLSGCDVKAFVGGYESTSIILNRQSALDDPNVGTIYLHRLGAGEAEGYTVSVTTKVAPKEARRQYEKGLESKQKQKWSEAEQEFSKAVAVYPQYAAAWYAGACLPAREEVGQGVPRTSKGGSN